jgi:hypothetical protein
MKLELRAKKPLILHLTRTSKNFVKIRIGFEYKKYQTMAALSNIKSSWKYLCKAGEQCRDSFVRNIDKHNKINQTRLLYIFFILFLKNFANTRQSKDETKK